MARPKVFFIYFEGSDRETFLDKQKERYNQKGIDFIPIQYTEKGFFEPDFPDMDSHTKIIIAGHGRPQSDILGQLSNGDGNSLSYQAIADKLQEKMPAGGKLKITLISCSIGVGDSVCSHHSSFAGKLFKALVEKGFEPEISAGLSAASLRNDGRISRVQEIGQSLYPYIQSGYNKFFKNYYSKYPIKIKNNRIVNPGLSIHHPKAINSKVILTFNPEKVAEGYMETFYPYGYPNRIFEGKALSLQGLEVLMLKLQLEVYIAHHMKNVNEALKNIINDFEKIHPDIERIEQYIQFRNWLLEDRYYFDATAISAWIKNGEIFTDIPEEYRVRLTCKILGNSVLRDFNMDEIISHFSSENKMDLALSYYRLGLTIVHGRMHNYPTPISLQRFNLLDEKTRHKLAIELGRKMVKINHKYDEVFVERCINQCIEKEAQLYQKGMREIDNMTLRKEFALLREIYQRKLAIELGKKEENLKHDIKFLEDTMGSLQKLSCRTAGEQYVKEKGLDNGLPGLSEEEKEQYYIELGKKIKNLSHDSDIIEQYEEKILEEIGMKLIKDAGLEDAFNSIKNSAIKQKLAMELGKKKHGAKYDELFLNKVYPQLKARFYRNAALQFVKEKCLEEELVIISMKDEEKFYIELGRKTKNHSYDEEFLNRCMEKVFKKAGDKILEAKGIKNFVECAFVFCIIEDYQRLAVELGKRAKGWACDESFIEKCDAAMAKEIEEMGLFLVRKGECVFSEEEIISFESFTKYLDADQQKKWTILVGKAKFNVNLSKEELAEKLDILTIVRLSEEIDDTPSYQSSPLTFFPAVKRDEIDPVQATNMVLKT